MRIDLRVRRRAAGVLGPVACVCGALTAMPAHADVLAPFHLGAGVFYGSDSNLFRTADATAQSDTYMGVEASVGLDQAYRRQRVRADLSLRNTHYDARSDLDNAGHDVRLQWDGATAGSLSGAVVLRASQGLANHVDTEMIVLGRNIERARSGLARIQYGLAGPWHVTAAVERRELEYSATEFASQENTQRMTALGLRWLPGAKLDLSFGPRWTRGRYPNAGSDAAGNPVADAFERRDLDLNVTWTPNSVSNWSARFSASEESHDVRTQRNLDTATGALRWNWQPTGKLVFDLMALRDTGSETTRINFGSAENPFEAFGDTSVLTSRLSFDATYLVTAKIRAAFSLQAQRRRFASVTKLASIPLDEQAGRDRLVDTGLSLRYEPMRSTLLECRVSYTRRSVQAGTLVPYTSTQASCSAQVVLR